ncbi:MAG: hypothetical protein M1831_000390 [Alyxoria varia]|nr:MAG: hypothetical protein M1831_000390 [Alyxoria varia]
MSASPQKDEEDVEPEAAKTPAQDQEVQHPEEEPMQGHPATQEQEQGLLYETEVKEQDRWLPIANGWFKLLSFSSVLSARSRLREPSQPSNLLL